MQRMTTPHRIRAIFSGGVFKPISAVHLPDNAEVDLALLDGATFDSWWQAHSERMAARSAGIAPSEIESDVGEAFEEMRAERRHPT
jgi:predicted DNA-binding antitoxin AbrB/MazE fold protein